MPCFRGLAVSIHTPDGPLPEYSIQKQGKFSRITTYIAVPPPKVSASLDKPEQSTFAISITLLTPGLNVPYSTPKPTAEDPSPRPKTVSGTPDFNLNRGRHGTQIGPYIPLTASPSETIAAYIYFDGRPKEEVATLLRRGEETWVNSRWVSIPEAEGGGLAEREFIFREVGLERWLNGLDLKGSTQDVQARIQRRRDKLAKKKIKKEEADEEDPMADIMKRRRKGSNGVLRYGDDKNAPVETLSDEESDDSASDSDAEAMPEATGQIKVALFRVIASGEIKKGEYSPQFDVHEDDDEANAEGGGGGGDADVDHTTSFAKPKTLDPKSISTQTVTGIDPPDKPYAVFTFFYRGERQLRKMGILASSSNKAAPVVKKESHMPDFSKMGALATGGKKAFEGYRDTKATARKAKDEDAMDSDADDDDEDQIALKINDDTEKSMSNSDLLAPEDALREEALTEGVRKIRLKRQHSAEPLDAVSPSAPGRSPDHQSTTAGNDTAAIDSSDEHAHTSNNNVGPTSAPSISINDGQGAVASAVPSNMTTADSAAIGSPFKKQRASMSGIEDKFLDKFRKNPMLEALGNSTPRRESDGSVVGPTSAANGSATGDGRVSKLELGPPLQAGGKETSKIGEEIKMDEEEEL